MDFILVPGAWAAEWLWSEVANDLESRGHRAHQITLSGLGPQASAAEVTLETHVHDLGSYLAASGVQSPILVGHSYSGIVVGQFASRSPDLVRHTIFVEAFLPVAGQSLLEVSGLDIGEETRAIESSGGYWPAPTQQELAGQPNLSDAQIKRLVECQRPHPGRTVTDPAKLVAPLRDLSASFIAHDGWLSGSREQGLIEDLRASGNWSFHEIDGGHWPMLTIPRELGEVLDSCVA